MYRQHKDSEKHLVYEVEVNLLPTKAVGKKLYGVVWDYFKNDWGIREIHKSHPKKLQQKWGRMLPSFNYERERVKEKQKQKTDSDFIDQRLEGFRQEEWDRRINGFWFYNNGVPTYITGLNYYYLNWWFLDNRYPDYRETDRDWFYLWDYCVQDPKSFGMVDAAARRTGKTAKAGCVLTEKPTRTKKAQCGLQSKTEDDAAHVMDKIIESYLRLPDFFTPILYTQGNKKPVGSLQWKAKNITENPDDSGLESAVTYRSSKPNAYDGFKMTRYLWDECGKLDNINIFYAWQVLRETFAEGTNDIVGKALFTTTIEEGGSDAFELLWDRSDPNKKNEVGQTTSGLYRLFTPAYKNDRSFIDEYGVCDEKAAKSHQQKVRDSLRSDERALAEYIRKYPWTIEEAFFSINDEAIFPTIKINKQIKAVQAVGEDELTIRGNFRWEERDKRVRFIPNDKGKFLVHKKVDLENKLLWNAVELGTKPRPLNSLSIVGGSDPYDHKLQDVNDKKRASKGAGYIFHKFDGLNSEMSETFLCEYLSRPEDPDDFYEDMIMMCFFFGCKMITERNKSGMINYWDRRGYGHWLIKDQKGHRGISAGTENKQWLAEVTESYIVGNIHKVPFLSLLYDWNKFDLTDSRKNDATMGAGWALVAAYRVDKRLMKNDPTNNKPVKLKKNKRTTSSLLKYL